MRNQRPPAVTVFDQCLSDQKGNDGLASIDRPRNCIEPVNSVILAPCYFEMLCVELANISQKASSRYITFVMEISKGAHEWSRGIDIWRKIGGASIFPLQNLLPLLDKLKCVDAERRLGANGIEQYFFRLKHHVHLVKQESLNGKLMLRMYDALHSISSVRPRQTSRIGLLLYAVFARRLVIRSEIDDYLSDQSMNTEKVLQQINLLVELKFIRLLKSADRQHAKHFITPID